MMPAQRHSCSFEVNSRVGVLTEIARSYCPVRMPVFSKKEPRGRRDLWHACGTFSRQKDAMKAPKMAFAPFSTSALKGLRFLEMPLSSSTVETQRTVFPS